nr:polyprotein [Hydrocotyle umbellata endornavirus]
MKLKHPFIDRDKKIIYTMPARFSEKLDMYGFEFLCTSQLDPKVISKLIYIITNLGFGFTDPDKIDNLRTIDIDHSYVGKDKPKSGYKMMDSNWQPIKIPDCQSLDFDMATCGGETKVLSMIKDSVNKFGGWLNYCLKNTKARPDAFGRITHTNGKIQIEPCGLVPVKMCKFCGTINIYSQYSAGNGVHDSVKHYHEKWLKQAKMDKSEIEPDDVMKVDKNDFPTKYNKDGTCEVMWRCCMCQGDLNIDVRTTLAQMFTIIKAVWESLFVLCGRLDELMKQGYGDIYDELNEQQKLTIRSHDKAIVKEYFFHMRQKIIMCGNDLDRLSRAQLGRKIANLYMTHDSKLNSIKPELIVEVCIANKAIVQSTRELNHEIRYNIIPNNLEKTLHNTMFDDWCFKNKAVDFCNREAECNCPGEKVTYFGFAGCKATVLELLYACCLQGHTYILVPKLNDHGQFEDETGYTTTSDGHIYLFVDGANQPLIMNEDTFSVLSNYDCIIFRDKLFLITTELTMQYVKIRMITGPYNSYDQIPTHKNLLGDHPNIKMNLPKIEGIMGNWSGLNFKEVQFKLDMPLFRALCLRNLSGKVSYENAREFAVGYSIRNFMVNSKQIVNAHVQYTDIDVHVLLSQICMMTLRGDYTSSIKYVEWSRCLGPLRSAIPTIDNYITKTSLFVITELLHYVTGLEANSIITLMSKSNINNWVKGFCCNDFWQNLLMMADELQVEELSFYKLESNQKFPTFKTGEPLVVCQHHKEECEHEHGDMLCECCSLPSSSVYCECCATGRPTGFWEFVDTTVSQQEDDDESGFGLTVEKVKRRIKENEIYKQLMKDSQGKLEPTQLSWESRRELAKRRLPDVRFSRLEFPKLEEIKRDAWGHPMEEATKEQETDERPTSPKVPFAKIVKEGQDLARKIKEIEANIIKPVVPELPGLEEDTKVTEEIERQKETTIDQTTPETPEVDTGPTPIKVERHKYKDVTYKKLKPIKFEYEKEFLLRKGNVLNIETMINEMLPILGNRFVKHVTDPIYYEGLANQDTEFNYILEHLPMGLIMVNTDTFKIVKTQDIPNTDLLTCGFDAYINATGSGISLETFRAITGKPNTFSDMDLIDVATAEETNLIVVTENIVYIMHGSERTDEYHCILLIPPTEGATIGHFVRCKIERVKDTPIYLMASETSDREIRHAMLKDLGLSQTELYRVDELTKENNLEIECKVANMKKHLSNMYSSKLGATIYNIKGVHYFTNNATRNHDLSLGEFNVQLEDSMIGSAQKLITVLTSDCTDDSIPGHFDKPLGLPNDLVSFRKDYIDDNLRQLCRARDIDHMTDEKNVKAYYSGYIKPWNGMSKLMLNNVSNMKLKLLDKVVVEIGKVKKVFSIVDRDGKDWMINLPSLTELKVNVIESKLSFGSTLRNILSMLKPLVNPNQFRRILANTRLTIGPAGCGKTTEISKIAKPNDVILAMTSEAVNNLKHKVQQCKQIYSIEKFKTLPIEREYDLIIDEATMLDWFALWPLVKDNTKVSLYGSDKQIGYIDTSETPGVRSVDPISKLITPENIIRLNTSYRIGEPLITDLRVFDEKIKTLADHRTEAKIECYSWDDKDQIKASIIAFKPQVILCMYNKVKSEISALIPEAKQMIQTTHSFQGNEVDYAVVVLKSGKGNEWGLNGDALYLYSAITRAKHMTKIIVVDHQLLPPYTLAQLITKKGGEDDPEMEIDLITINNMHTLSEQEVDSLNEMNIDVKGAKLKYETIEGGVICKATMFGLEVATIKNQNGTVTVTGASHIINQINRAKNTPIPILRSQLAKNMIKKKLKLTMRASARLKELGWLIDKHPKGAIEWKLWEKTIKFIKGSGCPTMSSYTIIEGENQIIISNAWEKLLRREIIYKCDTKLSELAIILDWLDIKQNVFYTQISYCDTWLNVMEGDIKTTIAQFGERLSNMHIWILNAMFNDKGVRCHVNNMKNVYKFNNFVGHNKARTIDYHQSVMPHKSFILEANNWIGRRLYRLVTSSGEVVSVKVNDNTKDYKEFIVEALSDLWFKEPEKLLKGIDTNLLDIPGLLLSVQKHMQENTKIAEFIKNNITQMILETKNPMRDFILVNTKKRASVTNMLSVTHPHQQLMPTEMSTYLSTCEIVVEQICMNYLFRQQYSNSPIELVYGGCFIIGLCFNNLYNVKLMDYDPNNHTLMHFKMQWHIYNDMRTSRFKSAEIKPKSTDLISNLHGECILLLGIEIISYNAEKIIDLMKQNKSITIFGAVPIETSPNQWYHMYGKQMIAYKDGMYLRKIGNNLINLANTGRPMFVCDGEYISVEVCFEIASHKVICLTWRKIPNTCYIKRSSESTRVRPSQMELTVPWINFNFNNLMETSSLVTTKKIIVNVKLLRNLLIRLMTGNDSWDSLLAYARTVESTYIVTESRLDDMQAHSIPELLNTAWYALFIHKNYLGKFKLLSQIVDKAMNSELTLQLLNQLVPGLMELTNVVSEIAEEKILSLIKYLSKRLKLSSEAIQAIGNLERSEWLKQVSKHRVIKYKFKGHVNSTETTDDNKPDEDNDDDEDTHTDKKPKKEPNELSRTVEKLGKRITNWLAVSESDSNGDYDEPIINEIDSKLHSQSENVEIEEYYEDASQEFTTDEEDSVSGTEDSSVEDFRVDIVDEIIEQHKKMQEKMSLLNEGNTPIHHLTEIEKNHTAMMQELIIINERKEKFDDVLLACVADNMNVKDSSVTSAFKGFWNSLKLMSDAHIKYVAEINLSKLCAMNTEKIPITFITSEKNNNKLPKLIWAYWHSREIPMLVWKMIMSWQRQMDDYSVILVTRETSNRYLENEIINCDDSNVAQYSDIIRCALLAKYGGVYIDASSYMTKKIDKLVNWTVNSDHGIFQFSIFDNKNLNKSYENWFIICCQGNKYMASLASELQSMNKANVTDKLDLQVWLKTRFDEVTAEVAIRGVSHEMMYYLRTYTVQQALIYKYNLDMSQCIYANECPIIYWSSHHEKTWVEKIKNLWDCNIDSIAGTQPVLKLVSNLRMSLITYDNMNGVAFDNSLLEILRKTELEIINVCNRIPLITTETRGELAVIVPKLMIKQSDVYIICTGTTGDLDPCIQIGKLLSNSGKSVAIISHYDHENKARKRLTNVSFYPLQISSSELMRAGISFYNNTSTGVILNANNLHTNLANEIETLLDKLNIKGKIIIATGMVPNLDNLIERYSALWTITNPFPLEWVTGSSSSKISTNIKNLLAKAAIQFKAKLTKKMRNEKIIVEKNMLYTYNVHLMDTIPDTENENIFIVGPLTSSEGYSQTKIDKTKRYVTVMFGSCMNFVNHYHMQVMIEYFVSNGYDVILNMDPSQIKPHSHLENLVISQKQKVMCFKEVNLRAIQANVDAVICHGGAGTVNESIRYKIPVLVYPIFADQPYWAKMIKTLGYGEEINYNSMSELLKTLDHAMVNLPTFKRNITHNASVINNGKRFNEWLRQYLPQICNVRMLNATMALSHGEIKASDLINPQIEWTPTQLGIFDTKTFEVQKEIKIKTSKQCVWQSIQKLLSVDGLKSIRTITNPSFIKLRSDAVKPEDCVNGILSIGLNLIIITDVKALCYNVYSGAPTIVLRFATSLGFMHCTPIISINCSNWRPVMITSGKMSQFSDELIKITEEITQTSEAQMWLIKEPELMIRWCGRETVADCKARLLLDSIVTIKTRRFESCITLELDEFKDGYCSVVHIKQTGLRLGLILGYTGWRPVVYAVKNEILVLLTDDPINKKNVLIDLGKPLENLIARPMSITSELFKACLNKPTKAQLDAENDVNKTDVMYSEGLKNYIILVTNYDNRKHHKMDELAIMQGAIRVLGANNTILDVDKFAETHDLPINRLCLINGDYYYTTEFSGVQDANLGYELIKAYTRITKTDYLLGDEIISRGSNIYTRLQLTSEMVTMMKNYYHEDGHKVVLTHRLDERSQMKFEEFKELFLQHCRDWEGIAAAFNIVENINWNNEDEIKIIDRSLNLSRMTSTSKLNLGIVIEKDRIHLLICDITVIKSGIGGAQEMEDEDIDKLMIETQTKSRTQSEASHNEHLRADKLTTHDRESWKDNSTEFMHSASNKWGIDENSLRDAIKAKLSSTTLKLKNVMKPDRLTTVPEFKEVSFINIMTYSETDYTPSIDVTGDEVEVHEDFLDIYIAPYSCRYCADDVDVIYDWPSLEAIKLWEDVDLTNWLTMYAPLNEMRIVSNELPLRVIETEKVTLTKYPHKSRAVLTKVCYEEIRSIAGRLGSVVKVRKQSPEPISFANRLAETYFKPDWKKTCEKYARNPIVIDPEDVRSWIAENKSCPLIIKELVNVLGCEMLVKPLSDVNIHLKLESLLKDEPIKSWREQQARIIVWQRKAVCAIYSKVFVEAKNRLKEVLRNNILYTDGLRPDEISARLRLTKNAVGFFENDLKKQDRQTDEPIIEVEMRIYALLGVHPNVISSWRMMHDEWRFKSKHCRGTRKAMRLTGQATTAIGNCITNMQVHCEFVRANSHALELALFLGDDMCMVFNEKPNIKKLKEYIASHFNMQSKENWHNDYGTFCSMLVTKLNEGNCQLAPDIVRMKYRYEVTNGVHETDEVSTLMRAASYLMTLGLTPEVKNAIIELKLPIRPIEWYDFNLMMKGCMSKYNMSHLEVKGYYDDLLNMITKPTIYRHKFIHYTSEENIKPNHN